MKKFLSLAICVLTIGTASAQTMVYEDVQKHDTPFYPLYTYTQQGAPVQGPYTFPFYSFFFSVKDATGDAAFLNGGEYIGFCVNSMFPDPQTNDVSTFSAGPTLLTYNLGTGDYWDTDRNIKWDAIKNTIAHYSSQLRSFDPDGLAYAELVTGMQLAFTEIILDYDGTIGSIDINAGDAISKLNVDGDPITSGVPFDTYNYIRTNLIGTGDGGAFEVYTANVTGDVFQDLAFISAVPEPTTAIYLLVGAVVLAGRRARRH